PEKSTDSIWINQDAWFSLTKLEKGKSLNYSLNQKGNGVYAFILKGDVMIADQALSTKDGLGITDADEIPFLADTDAEILLMEVPISF
ncbi:MAG: pirin family protein, partial [Chitinophagaceae bacterium]